MGICSAELNSAVSRIWNPQALWQVSASESAQPCRVQLGDTAGFKPALRPPDTPSRYVCPLCLPAMSARYVCPLCLPASPNRSLRQRHDDRDPLSTRVRSDVAQS